MTTEEKIHIAASFDSEKIKMIRELIGDEAENFRQWLISEEHIEVLTDVDYKCYQNILQQTK